MWAETWNVLAGLDSHSGAPVKSVPKAYSAAAPSAWAQGRRTWSGSYVLGVCCLKRFQMLREQTWARKNLERGARSQPSPATAQRTQERTTAVWNQYILRKLFTTLRYCGSRWLKQVTSGYQSKGVFFVCVFVCYVCVGFFVLFCFVCFFVCLFLSWVYFFVLFFFLQHWKSTVPKTGLFVLFCFPSYCIVQGRVLLSENLWGIEEKNTESASMIRMFPSWESSIILLKVQVRMCVCTQFWFLYNSQIFLQQLAI